ncbi:unnamed protein product [Rhizopus stolonifer]
MSLKNSALVVSLVYAVYKVKKHAQLRSKEAEFFLHIKTMLPLCVPSLFSKESGLLVLITSVLVTRTWLDIWFSGFHGRVIKTIVTRNHKGFITKAILQLSLMMWPMSIIQHSLELLTKTLSLSFRERLTKYAHGLYLDSLAFYKSPQPQWVDIHRFSDIISHLYLDTTQSLVEITLFSFKLAYAINYKTPFLMMTYFISCHLLLNTFSPHLGSYHIIEQKLQDDLRLAHSRIVKNSEEIAFHRGGQREKKRLNDLFEKISTHTFKINTLRFLTSVFDSVLVKYGSSMVAYYLLARPIFDSKDNTMKHLQDYTRNSSYMIHLSQAVDKFIWINRDLTRLAMYSSRVFHLFQNLICSEQKVVKKDMISFNKVSIMTPKNDLLIKDLYFTLTPGMHCFISGPKGSGKTAIFRALTGLWSFTGLIVQPDRLLHLPQRAYFFSGSLREQLIYPDTKTTDEDLLLCLLNRFHLSYLKLDTVSDWDHVLSEGEKQRVAIIRLFYHRPQFAILDECTSAISADVEALIYTQAKKMSITLLTISNKNSLVHYHDFLLTLDGQGHYEFKANKE